MSLSRPSAVLTLDGQTLSAAEAALARLEVDLSSGSHDAARVTLWPESKFKDAQAGSTLEISLGEAGDEELVWTGQITGARRSPEAVTLEGLAATIELSRARRSQTFVAQTVADIVKDLAGDVTVDTVEGAVELAVYSVDNERPVWAYLCDLARLLDADLASSPDGGLRFVPREGPATPSFARYGAEVLDWRWSQAPQPHASATAPHGAGSEEGSDRWHWLLNDPVGADADQTRIVGALRARDGADTATAALAARAERAAVRGSVSLLGKPSLRPGDSLELKDMPDGDPGSLRIRDVLHILDADRGFITVLTVESAGSGGLGL